MDTISFYWNEDKNERLKSERNISFEEIARALEEGDLLDVINNPNQIKFPNQFAIVVKINNYAIVVPFVSQSDGSWFFKTAYPNRKLTKKYL